MSQIGSPTGGPTPLGVARGLASSIWGQLVAWIARGTG
jgi:hypothetical protein